MWFNLFLQRQDITNIKLLVWNSVIAEGYELKNITSTFKIFRIQDFLI